MGHCRGGDESARRSMDIGSTGRTMGLGFRPLLPSRHGDSGRVEVGIRVERRAERDADREERSQRR